MVRIASHRGGTLEFGDSTLLGFTKTAAMDLEEVEFDVHPTSDGAFVVHHDTTLDATTDTCGVISEMTLAAVKAATIRYSSGSNPLTLEELCDLYVESRVNFRCEMKLDHAGQPYRDFVKGVVTVLHRRSMLGRTVFSSFAVDYLDEVGKVADASSRLWLVSPSVLQQLGASTVIEIAKSHNIPEVGLHIDTASEELRDLFVAESIQFGCWAAHTKEQIKKALSLNVKVFTTDRPTLAIALRKNLRETTCRS
ncbi:glycerophosphodiester phosphodiesterase family protein [Agrobacterium sp. 22-222-1]